MRLEAIIKEIVEDMSTYMYIPEIRSNTKINYTYNRYARVVNNVRLREPVLKLNCSLSNEKYSQNAVKTLFDLVHIDSRTLFSNDEFTAMVYIKATDRSINNERIRVVYRSSFYTANESRCCLILKRSGLSSTRSFPINTPKWIRSWTLQFRKMQDVQRGTPLPFARCFLTR